MKKILLKLLGIKGYCRTFHTCFEDKNDKTKWHCYKCKLSFDKKPSDGDTGPR